MHLHKRSLRIWFEDDESCTVFPMTFDIVIVFNLSIFFGSYIEENTALLSPFCISACLVGLTSHLFSIMWWFRPCIHILHPLFITYLHIHKYFFQYLCLPVNMVKPVLDIYLHCCRPLCWVPRAVVKEEVKLADALALIVLIQFFFSFHEKLKM